MAQGALVLVVGPSGAGKDALIAAAREALEANTRFTFPRRVVTRQVDNHILSGITRAVLLNVLEALQLRLEERAFTAAEAYGAAEAFVTSASQIVMPVVKIDGRDIGDGKPGSVAKRLREEFHRFAHVS